MEKKAKRKIEVMWLVRATFLLILSFYIAYIIENSYISLFDSLSIFTAQVFAKVVNGYNEGALVIIPHYHKYVQIVHDCVGWKTAIALLTLWLIIPLPFILRLIFILSTPFIAFIVNLNRLILASSLSYYFNLPYGLVDIWIFGLFNSFILGLIFWIVYRGGLKK